MPRRCSTGWRAKVPIWCRTSPHYLNAGWLIAATDYQGLGVSEGIHPYLVGASEGQGVLDAAQAARQLPHLRVSGTVLVYGHSQGGQAALFAGELAPSYAPSLQVIGVVAAAPATGLSEIVAVLGQINKPDDLAYFTLIGWTWSQTYPGLPASDVFTASGALFARQIVTGHCDNGLVAALAARSPGTEFLAMPRSILLSSPGPTSTIPAGSGRRPRCSSSRVRVTIRFPARPHRPVRRPGRPAPAGTWWSTSTIPGPAMTRSRFGQFG